MTPPVELSDAAIEAIARRVVELQSEQPPAPERTEFTAAEVAAARGVTRGWVYDNAAHLGGVRLGSGPRARIRFPASSLQGTVPQASPAPPSRRHRQRRAAVSDTSELLPIEGHRG